MKEARPEVSGTVSLNYCGDTAGTYDGFDQFGRVVDQAWRLGASGTVLDRYTYGYDFASNCTWRQIGSVIRPQGH